MSQGSDFETKWELLVTDAWDDPELKQRLLNDPRSVLRERGIAIPEGLEIRVLEDSETVEHLVLPEEIKPYELSEDELSYEEMEAFAGGTCRGCRGSRGCFSCRGCRSCRNCRSSRGCRP